MSHPFAPSEAAPILKTFGELSGHVGALVRAEPRLALRWALAPQRALHATAIYLHNQSECGKPLEELAGVLLDHHPKHLIGMALPDVAPRLYRLLDRATLPAWSRTDYVLLNDVLRSEIADVFGQPGDITPRHARDAEAILHCHPLVLQARHAVTHAHQRRALETLIDVLDRAGLLNSLNALPEDARARGLANRIVADLGRAEQAPMDFPVPRGWTRVLRVADLWQHGTQMRLCLRPGNYGGGDYVMSLLMNRSVFLHHAEANLLAQFREMPTGAWTLAQCVAEGNGPAPEGLARELAECVEQAGVTLLPVTLGDALDTLLQPLRERDRGAGRAHDPFNGGEDDELEAGALAA